MATHAGAAPAKAVARIAELLRERRTELGFSQEELAQALGLPRQYLSQLESGHATTQLTRLVEVLSSVGLDLVAVPRTHPAAVEFRTGPPSVRRRVARARDKRLSGGPGG